MATLMSAIVADARVTINGIVSGTSDAFWSDSELLGYGNQAIKELWKGIIDLYQGHFLTIDNTTMSIAAGASTVTGVPSDLFRVERIRPRVLNDSNRGLIFKYRTITHPDFVQAEAVPAVTPQNTVIYYAVVNAGAPVGAPAILLAPPVASAVNLWVAYAPSMAAVASSGNNPIPGESDVAIKAYIVAWALARQRPANDPDPEYISVYATEKRNILTALTPRSVQEPETVMGFWEPSAADVVPSTY